jgi:hypothetical protein
MAEWRDNLSSFMGGRGAEEVEPVVPEFDQFLREIVSPAFKNVKNELEGHGRTVVIREAESSIGILIHREKEEELSYRLSAKTLPHVILPIAAIRYRERKGLKYVTIESMLRSGSQDYTLVDLTETEIIEHLLKYYMKHSDFSA